MMYRYFPLEILDSVHTFASRHLATVIERFKYVSGLRGCFALAVRRTARLEASHAVSV